MAMEIKPQVETLLDKTQNITTNGNGNKTAGRDLLDYSTTIILEATKHSSSIGKILEGISEFSSNVKYQKPDTAYYTVEDKIDHNNLKKYKEFFDDYMDNYSVVKRKITIFEEGGDITFEKRLIFYIRNKYERHFNANLEPDDIVRHIVTDIETELKNHSSVNLDLDDISGIHYVVFYVFAECKIFAKP